MPDTALSDPFAGYVGAAPAVPKPAPTGTSTAPATGASDPFVPFVKQPAKGPDLGRVAGQFAYGAAPGVVGGLLDTPAWILSMITDPSKLDPSLPKTGVQLLDPQFFANHTADAMTAVGLNPGEPQDATESVARGAGAGAGGGAALGGKAGPFGAVVGALAGAALGGGTAYAQSVAPPERTNEIALGGMALGALGGMGVRAGNDAGLVSTGARTVDAAGRLASASADLPKAGAALNSRADPSVPQNPTLAQRSGDAGFAAAQNALAATRTPQGGMTPIAAEIAGRVAEQNATRVGTLDTLGGAGTPDALATGLQAARAQADATTAAGVRGATTAAQTVTSALLPGTTPETLGASAQGAATAKLTSLKSTENAAWDKTRALPTFTVPGDAVANIIKNTYSGLTPEARLPGGDTGMSAFEGRLQDLALGPVNAKTGERAGGYAGADLGSQNLIDLTRRVGEEITKADGIERGRLKLVYGSLLGLMSQTLDDPALAAQKQAFGAAKAASLNRFRYEATTPVSTVLKGAAAPDAATGNAIQAKLPATVWQAGPAGAQVVKQFTNAVGPDGEAVVREMATSSLRQAAEREDGTLDPAAFDKWRTKYGDALRALPPNLVHAFDTAADASRTIEAVAQTRKEVLDSYQAGHVGAIIGNPDPGSVTAEVGKAVFASNAPERLMALTKTAQAAGPDAVAGLRRAVVDSITGKFVDANGQLASGAGAGSFLGFLAKPQTEGALRAVGFSPKEIETLRQIGAQIELNTRLGVASSTRDAGVVTPTPPAVGTIETLGRLAKGASWVGGTAAVASLAPLLPGVHWSQLATAGAGAAVATLARVVRSRGIKSSQELLNDAILDPKAANALLSVLKNPTSNTVTAFASALGQGAVLGATVGQQPLPRRTGAPFKD